MHRCGESLRLDARPFAGREQDTDVRPRAHGRRAPFRLPIGIAIGGRILVQVPGVEDPEALKNFNMALGLFDPVLGKQLPSFTALKMTADSAGFVGGDDLFLQRARRRRDHDKARDWFTRMGIAVVAIQLVRVAGFNKLASVSA